MAEKIKLNGKEFDVVLDPKDEIFLLALQDIAKAIRGLK